MAFMTTFPAVDEYRYTLCVRSNAPSGWSRIGETMTDWDALQALAIQMAWSGEQVAYVHEETGGLEEFQFYDIFFNDGLKELEALSDIIKDSGLAELSVDYDGKGRKILICDGNPAKAVFSGDFDACREYLGRLAKTQVG